MFNSVISKGISTGSDPMIKPLNETIVLFLCLLSKYFTNLENVNIPVNIPKINTPIHIKSLKQRGLLFFYNLKLLNLRWLDLPLVK